MKTYKILWIDDQYETLDNFQLKAERNGILLEGFKSFEEGFAYLDSHLNEFSGVLLDARFFSSRDDEPGDETLTGLSLAVSRLDQLHTSEKLPWFILSGQADLERNSFFSETYGKHYVKFNEVSEQALFVAIKDAADKLVHTRMRHQYADAFAACTSRYAGERAGRLLYDVLAALHEPQLTHGDDLAFNTLRQILEEVFMAACSHGFLPPECIANGKVNITNSGQLLSGKPVKVSNTQQAKLHNSLMPEVLADLIDTLVSLTHNGSHAATPATSSRLIALRQSVRTPYLQAALTYQILDLLVWFKTLLDDTTTRAGWHYTALPVSGAVITGKVERITASDWGTFRADSNGAKASISPNLVRTHSLKMGQIIQVILYDSIAVKSIPA